MAMAAERFPVEQERREVNAYRYAPRIRPGCQHQLGCGCDVPYWLRASSKAEEAIEAAVRGNVPA